jgi:competence protein ComEC
VWLRCREYRAPDPLALRPSDEGSICYITKALPPKNDQRKLEVLILGRGKRPMKKTAAVLYVASGSQLQSGDSLLVPHRWKRIRNSGVPGDFDIAGYYASKQIYLRSFCKMREVIVCGHNKRLQRNWLQAISSRAAGVLDRSIQDPTGKALLKAMLLGDETEIDPETREAYSDTGIIHIISISGAHVALLFALIQYALFWVSGKHKKIYLFLLSSILIFSYVSMAGAPSSAVRAAAMFFLVQLGILSGQKNNPLNQLCAAAFIMLLFRPLWLYHIGFQLSFLAVSSLMIYYAPLIRLWPAKNKGAIALRNAIAASIAAEILVAPLVAYYFHSFPLLFLPANLIAALGMTLLESMGIALLLFHKIGLLASALADAITVISQLFHLLIHYLQNASFDALKRIYLSLPALLCCYLLIVASYQLIKRKSRKAVLVLLLCLSVLSGIHCMYIVQGSTKELLVLWWQAKGPNAIVMKSGKARRLQGINCNQRTIQQLLIANNARVPDAMLKQGFIVSNQRCILIDSNCLPHTNLHTDIVILNAAQYVNNPETLLNNLHTKTIVLAKYLPAKSVMDWRRICRSKGIRFHYLPSDGAFVWPAQ